VAVFTATGRGLPRRRSAAVLATAALGLGLTVIAGPARATATSGPTVPLTHPVAATAAGLGLANDPGPAPAPTPPAPAPLAASGPPAAQAIAAKYQADEQTVATRASAVGAEQGPLETRAGDVQTREANLAGQFASIQARTNTLNGQADALSSAIARHNSEPHQFQLPAQASQLAAYNQEKAGLETQQSSLQNQFSVLTTQTNQLQSAQAQADADQAKVNADIQKHNTAVAALQTDISNLAAERQADLLQIANLFQNFYINLQNSGGATPLANAGGDQSAPPAAAAPPPQASALPSAGGDQAAPPMASTYEPVASGATGTAAAPTGSAASPLAGLAPVGAQSPMTATLQASALSGLPPAAVANLNPAQTVAGLIPEANGNYAAMQPPLAAGTTAPPAQKAFSDVINNGGKATVYINGKPVTIDHVVPVTAAPAVNQGGDTARPAKAAPLRTALPNWLPRVNLPTAGSGPAISINVLRDLLNQKGLGKLANQFDLEYAPVVLDGYGNPTYGVAPTDAFGNPLRGATGKPALRFSNLGLQNPGKALNTFDQEALGSGSPCPEHSFSGATRVLMADGSTKAIADVEVGDLVENAQPGGGSEVHRVDQIHVTTTDTGFTDVVVASAAPGEGGTVTGTANHPYFDATAGGFVDAGALRVGDRLQSGAESRATVSGIRPHVGPIVTYDLTIDGLHTYYVEAGTTPVLVHNCDEDQYTIRDHVIPRHMPGGEEADPTKSLFDPQVDLEKLAEGSAGQIGTYQAATKNIRYIITSKDIIGNDRFGRPTRTYTIVRESRDGELVTMFPGLPSDIAQK
jgi:hypothetical protein